MKLQSPVEFFGFEPGSDYHMILWDDIVAYFQHLSDNSPLVETHEIGKSTEGKPFLSVYITSEDNMQRLEEYRRISCRLAEPEGLSTEQIEKLADEGKAVCVQTYSLHANEVGGTQATPLIAWDLISSDSEQIRNILENVIFIMIPCANPDGEVNYASWYQRSLGTVWEGSPYPALYHIYAGHDNNRDYVHEQLVETRNINRILNHEWMPQALMDHHHQCPEENRMSIAPCVNPNWPELSPLLTREEQVYGAQMACAMEEAGFKGIVSGDSWYNTYPIYSLAKTCIHSNVVGMLTESADARIATPVNIPKDRLWRYTKKCTECTSPWEGGEWGLPDIVRQIRKVSITLLEIMAQNKKSVLRRRAHKAFEQAERGRKAEIKGYLLLREQHDPSVLNRLLQILDSHRVEYHELAKPCIVDGAYYPAGTYYVSCAQARYSLVGLIFTRHPYPIEPSTVWEDGTIHVFDCSSTNIIDPMGLNAIPCYTLPGALRAPRALELAADDQMPANENASFLKANLLLEKQDTVWRNEAGDFFAQPVEGSHPVRSLRIALLALSRNCNGYMGMARLNLENYHFPVTVVTDRQIRAGALKDYDVLILPNYQKQALEEGEFLREGWPEEWRTGLAKDGAEQVKVFVERGGRLIAWDKSCSWAVELFGLQLKDMTGGKGGSGGLYDANNAFNSQGAILNVCLENNALTRGMPKYARIKHNSGPAWRIRAYENARDYEVIGRFAKEKVLNNGLLLGEKFLSDNDCAVRARVGRGDVILYSFDPLFRGHCMGLFKLLFNALYQED